MPQIEEVQTVWWGSLRPDSIELRTDGINVAAGPNGSGKTTFLDAIKVMLGVGDKLARRPADYIYDGGGDPARKADRAYVKVIFANPERPGRAGRVFADAGRGSELVPYVTGICEVTTERRRYLIQPGATRWGATQTVEADLHGLGRIPRSAWLTPKQWSELLARAGVSQALTGVISIQQGEIGRAIEGTPEQLLRRVLELIGKQETLDGFRAAKTKLAEARLAYDEARRKLDANNARSRRCGCARSATTTSCARRPASRAWSRSKSRRRATPSCALASRRYRRNATATPSGSSVTVALWRSWNRACRG